MNPNINFSNDPFLSDLDSENVKNFCSWLLNFNAYELPILSYAIAVLLSETFTIQERTVIGSIFSTIATNTFLIAAQQGFILQVESNRNSNENNKFVILNDKITYIEQVLKNNNLL